VLAKKKHTGMHGYPRLHMGGRVVKVVQKKGDVAKTHELESRQASQDTQARGLQEILTKTSWDIGESN